MLCCVSLHCSGHEQSAIPLVMRNSVPAGDQKDGLPAPRNSTVESVLLILQLFNVILKNKDDMRFGKHMHSNSIANYNTSVKGKIIRTKHNSLYWPIKLEKYD